MKWFLYLLCFQIDASVPSKSQEEERLRRAANAVSPRPAAVCDSKDASSSATSFLRDSPAVAALRQQMAEPQDMGELKGHEYYDTSATVALPQHQVTSGMRQPTSSEVS